MYVRTEMRAGGVWTNACRDRRSRQEWVALMRATLGVEDGRDVVSVPYAMPVEPLCVGAFIGYRSSGTTAIGCVTRVRGVVRSGWFLAQLLRGTQVCSDYDDAL